VSLGSSSAQLMSVPENADWKKVCLLYIPDAGIGLQRCCFNPQCTTHPSVSTLSAKSLLLPILARLFLPCLDSLPLP